MLQKGKRNMMIIFTFKSKYKMTQFQEQCTLEGVAAFVNNFWFRQSLKTAGNHVEVTGECKKSANWFEFGVALQDNIKVMLGYPSKF